MARSLRFWLSLGLTSAVSLAIAVVAVALLSVLIPRLNDQVEFAQRGVGVTLSSQIDTYLNEVVQDLEHMAADIATEPPSGSTRTRTVIDTTAQTHVDLDAVYLLDASGRVTDVGLSLAQRPTRDDLIGLDFSQRSFVKEALRTGLAVWSDTYLSPRGDITVAAVIPLRVQDNAPPRLLVGEFNVAWISRHVGELARNANVFAMIVDTKGHLVAHPDATRVLRQESFNLPTQYQPVAAKRISAQHFEVDGIAHIGTTVSIRGHTWTAVIAQPVDTAYATVRSTLWAIGAGSLSALLLALFAAYAYGQRIVRRVQEFGAHAAAVANGDYTAPLPFSRAEELNGLAESMRKMARAILARERALAESESRYRGLFEQAPLAYQSLALDTTVLAVNDAWLALTGYDREAVIGHPISDFIDEDSLPVLAENFPRFVDARRIDGPLFGIRGKDGSIKTVVINGRIHHDADGSARTHCILTDVTQRLKLEAANAQAEQILRRQSERAQSMLALPEAAARLDEVAFLQHGLAVVERLTNSPISFVHFINDDQESIELITWSAGTLANYCQAIQDPHLPISQAGIWADAMRQRKPVVVNDYPSADNKRGLPQGHAPLQRLISAPVFEGDQGRMLLGVGNCDTAYTDFDVETVQLLGQSIWRLVAQRRADAAMQLAASVFTASAEGICVTDAQKHIVSVNPALTAITGYHAKEIIGLTPKIFASGRHDADFYRDMWAQIATHGIWRGEIWNRRKNGEVFPEWLTISTVRGDDGAVKHYIGNFFDISERKRSEANIRFLAHHDALTRLPNRSLLEDRIQQAMAKSRRNQDHAAVMFLDLDRFKLVNDSLGHDVGDRLLVRIAERLQSVLRETETVARLGGDEFVVVIPELADVDRARLIAQKIIDVVSEAQDIDNRTLHVTASIGICIFPDDGADVPTLMRNADTAMYHAKDRGRNNYQFYTAAMNLAVRERVEIEADLRKALARGELVLHYQPQVDSRSGNILGMEALVRWQHPHRGLVPPAQFIPIAEESGLITEIGNWVLREACLQARRWHDAGQRHLRMGVNLSARQFQSADLQQHIASAIQDSGIDPATLELELTESMLMTDPQSAAEVLQSLAALGIGLAIDDFGTGYSSLSYLKRFPVTRLKIDQSFVRDISTDPDDAAIVHAVVAMANSLGLEVIAEGVETFEQLRFLEQHGCFEIQGYLFSRPVPPDTIRKFRFALS